MKIGKLLRKGRGFEKFLIISPLAKKHHVFATVTVFSDSKVRIYEGYQFTVRKIFATNLKEFNQKLKTIT